MKTFVLSLLLLQLTSAARAESVKLTDSAFARTTVAVLNSPWAKHHVYFSKSAIGADCGLFVTNSAFAESTVKVVKNAMIAQTTVRRVDHISKANTVVYLAKSASGTFGHCDFAAALLAR